MSNFPFQHRNAFTNADLDEIEISIGRKLPEAYREFVKEFGGAFIAGYPNTSDDFDILCFYEPEEYKGTNSLLTTYDDLVKIGAVPIAKCEFGNPFILTADNKIFYIDYDNGQTSSEKVADTFQQFLDKIATRRIDDPEDQ